MRRWPHVLTALLSVLPARAVAQIDGSLDLGAALLRQQGYADPGVLTLGAGLRADGYRAAVALEAAGARSGSGLWESDGFPAVWTGQGTLAASAYTSPLQRVRWEAGVSLSAFGASGELPTMSALFGVRQHIRLPGGGVFIGAEGGSATYDRVWRRTTVASAGGWWRQPVGSDRYSIQGSLTDTRIDALRQDSAGQYITTIPATYYDVALSWQRAHRRWTFAFTAGPRFGERGVDVRRFWGHGNLTFFARPALTLVATAGQALPDHVRGVPEAQYVSLAVRRMLRPRAMPIRGTQARERAPGVGDATLLVRQSSGTWRTFVVYAAGARAVEVMADFTGWEAVALAPRGSMWVLEGDVDAGVHRLLVRVNGGEWRVPANLTRAGDGFGGVIGLMTLP